MCNLYRMTRGTQEIARLFGAEADPGINFAHEVYPGYPGLVVEGGAARVMHWGFPLVLTGKQGQKLKPKPVAPPPKPAAGPAGKKPGPGGRRPPGAKKPPPAAARHPNRSTSPDSACRSAFPWPDWLR